MSAAPPRTSIRTFRITAGTVRESHPQPVGEVVLQRGVVDLGRRDVRLVERATVDREPGAVLGRLHLVRDRDVRVQVGIAGARLAVDERGRHDAVGGHLTDAVASTPGVNSA